MTSLSAVASSANVTTAGFAKSAAADAAAASSLAQKVFAANKEASLAASQANSAIAGGD